MGVLVTGVDGVVGVFEPEGDVVAVFADELHPAVIIASATPAMSSVRIRIIWILFPPGSAASIRCCP
jgi:hypothetical protein